VAPGTFGSAVGLVLFALIRWSGSVAIELGAIALLLALGVWSGNLAEKHFGRVDPAPVVLDEVAGMLITLALIPVTLSGAFVGFFIFRLFDVIKPWPANRFEALPGGLGMMADDAMAAVYGNLALRILVFALPAGWLA
jgi:phosphatidylglycerophosphatase A